MLFFLFLFFHVEVRLVDGLNSCQGRLEILLPTSDSFGQACDLDAGANEVQVVCRQLGCETVGARRVDPRTYVVLNILM